MTKKAFRLSQIPQLYESNYTTFRRFSQVCQRCEKRINSCYSIKSHLFCYNLGKTYKRFRVTR